MTRVPNVFLIGAPKAGTSALAHYLAEHPQVFFSRPKEPCYWSTDLPGFAHREGFTSLAKYEQLFAAATDRHRVVAEGSTHYLFSRTAVPGLWRQYPDAKFLVILRNPIELASGWHRQMLRAGYEDEPDFRRAWDLQSARARGEHLPPRCLETALLQYRQVASLGEQVERLLAVVPRERCCFFCYETFFATPVVEYRRLLQFLNLDDDGRREFERINEAAVPRSTLISWLTHTPAFRQFLNRTRFLQAGAGASRIRNALRRWLFRKPPREVIPSEWQRALRGEFADDTRRLSRALGFVVPWDRDETPSPTDPLVERTPC